MCGILGGYSNKANKHDVLQALKIISYRGPDYGDVYIDRGLYLGHRRLAIIDLDARSNQPLQSANEDLVIVFNGEIYNYQLLKKELLTLGYSFKTNSDTEVIINAYKKWGTNAFIKLQGMFALAIYDKTKQELILARDRTGEKPLFYSFLNEELCFGSELKAILPLINKRKISEKSILNFLTYGYVPAPNTIYEDVFKLEPGNFLIFNLQEKKIAKIEEFFTLGFSSYVNTRSYEDLKLEFEKILDVVAGQITIADVPLGVFLSGGVDSSGVTALLKNKVPNIKAFTIGFDDPKFDETVYARKVAWHLGVNHIVEKVEMNDVESVYSKLVSLYDEPFNDYSFIPTYYVCKEAKRHSTVVVSGDGADEIFCGYRKYTRLKKLEKLYNFPLLTKSIKGFSTFLPEQSDIKRQLFRMGLSEHELMYDLLAIVFKKRELVKVLNGSLLNEFNNYETESIVINHLKRLDENQSLLQKLRYLDIKMTLADDMLVKVDRASMINSLEVRPFFLHPDILNFALTLPEEYLSSQKEGKVFLKKYFEKFLPNDILYRRKMGFGIPLNDWLINDLKYLFEEAIKNLPEELFQMKAIENILDLHLKGGRDFIMQIHSLFFLGTWFKLNS